MMPKVASLDSYTKRKFSLCSLHFGRQHIVQKSYHVFPLLKICLASCFVLRISLVCAGFHVELSTFNAFGGFDS